MAEALTVGGFISNLEEKIADQNDWQNWLKDFKRTTAGYADFSSRAVTPESIASIAIGIYYVVVHLIDKKYHEKVDHQAEAISCRAFLTKLFEEAQSANVDVKPTVVAFCLKQCGS